MQRLFFLMKLTGTHFNYYRVCKRKLWLFANGINMEHSSDLVSEGRLLHETAYPQRPHQYEELEFDGIKIDYYDAKRKIIHEIKKSNKVEDADVVQVCFYIYKLEEHGIKDVKGILEYPLLRKTQDVILDPCNRERIMEIERDIESIVGQEICPEKIKSRICQQCSYYEFCFCNEEESE